MSAKVALCSARYGVPSDHRVGYAGSRDMAGTINIAQQSAHCRPPRHYLGIEWTHLVGRSSSGNMALQLALNVPDIVLTRVAHPRWKL